MMTFSTPPRKLKQRLLFISIAVGIFVNFSHSLSLHKRVRVLNQGKVTSLAFTVPQSRRFPCASATNQNGRSLSLSSLSMWNNGNGDQIYGRDRLTSCIPYVLPLLDGDKFGKYIYMRMPPLHAVEQVLLGPLLQVYHSIPFFGFVIFLLLTFGSRNTSLSRGVRFNIQQALLIDIALIFPDILGGLSSIGGGLPRFLVEPSTNFVYYTFIAGLIYSITSNISGKRPDQIPRMAKGYSGLDVSSKEVKTL